MSFTQFPSRFGKYILLDKVSTGGMAEIYRAKEVHESGFSRVVAIKRLSETVEADEDLEPMFVDEARLTSRLMHPNIAQTFELGRVNDNLYIAMELVWGRDLRAIIKASSAQDRKIPLPVVCYLISKAAEALDYAHNAVGSDGRPMRLVHRDVSPQNVLVGYDGEVKLIDFGIAKADQRIAKTQAGIIKGKFSYMAPEQAIGAKVDRRTDIFALGVLMYELIAGERLFDGSSAYSIYEKVLKQAPKRLSDVTQVPPQLEAVVNRCLAREPSDRFATASQLADALASFRISDRNIVSAREAAALLAELFPNDAAEMREKMRRDKDVSASDCPDGSYSDEGTQVLVKSDLTPSHLALRVAAEKPSAQPTVPLSLVVPESPMSPASPKSFTTPITVPITTPITTPNEPPDLLFQPTQVFVLRKIYRSTTILIAVIAALAATIIIAARSRNMTAMELFESLLRTSSADTRGSAAISDSTTADLRGGSARR